MYKLKFKYFHCIFYTKESLRMNGMGDGVLDKRTYCRSFQNLVPNT